MKKIPKSIIVVLSLCIILSSTAYAYTYINGERIDWKRKMTDGRSIYYWIAPTCEYTVSVPAATQLLMYPNNGLSNPMNLYSTNQQSNGKIEFHQYYVNTSTAAKTRSYRKNSSANYYAMPKSEKDQYDWVWAKIEINDYKMDGMSNTLRKTILVHEMLHAFGLRDLYESSNRGSIMYGYYNQWHSNVLNEGVTEEANDILNEKY